MNSLIRRRYAVQLGNKQGNPAGMLERPVPLHEIKNAVVHPDVGKPIHSVIHHAMSDAFHHLGLGEGTGEEQYTKFANLRDRANKELNDPSSKFTKLFNKHKSELSTVPNPREHLTDALLPLFNNLSQYEEVPESKESGPIDLLGSGHHHPFENDEGSGFEYKPRLPSGFVQVPHPDHNPKDWSIEHPKPKTKRNIIPTDKRKAIYQTIAHSLANRENVPQALQKEHGLSEIDANKHYQNYLKNKKKPEGKIRPENIQKPKGGKRRTRKFDKTDLMGIPVRYGMSPIKGPFRDMPEELRKGHQNRPRVPRGWGSIDTRTPGGYEEWEKDFPDQIHEITLDDEQPEEPIQKSAYRAPKGGVIVRGTDYTGGQLIPDLRGSFVNPRRKKINNFSQK